jgi:hypothetical protein
MVALVTAVHKFSWGNLIQSLTPESFLFTVPKVSYDNTIIKRQGIFLIVGITNHFHDLDTLPNKKFYRNIN